MDSKIKMEAFGERMNARNVLKDLIRRKENRLNALRVVERCIDWDTLSHEDEKKLWDFFTTIR